jgi:hypothetical protein
MKKNLLIASIILCAFLQQVSAQNCYLLYGYDNSGNRIKREYKCQTIVDPTQPDVISNPGGVVSKVYPIPTWGPFTVEFSIPVASAYMFLTDMSGMVLLERTISQPTTITTFDISSWVPGNYILTSIANDAMENFTITKL